jgi:PAS domain S-box-containing protein
VVLTSSKAEEDVTRPLGNRARRPPVRVLLIEGNPGEARLIQEVLRDVAGTEFNIERADRLSAGLERLGAKFDVILLDLALPDSQGLSTFTAVHSRAPTFPILVLADSSDQSLAVSALRCGAQDYLVKGQADGELLARSIRYAIERKQAVLEIMRLNECLEQRVLERTSQLEAANLELHHRRGELQDYIDAMSTLNAKVAPDGTLLLVNRSAQQASGLPPERLMRTSFLAGQWWSFDPEVQARVRNQFREACVGTFISYEEKLFAFGRVLTVHLTLVPVKNSDESVAYVVAEARDISRRVEAEEALKTANQELEALTYSVSHDLRAPIRQIDGFSRILSEQVGPVLDVKSRRCLRRIHDGAEHMGRLVDDLLHLAHVGCQCMRPTSVSLNKVIRGVLADLQPEVGDRDIEWRIGCLPTVRCDPGLMKVVFTNLLANAVKYTRPRRTAVIEVGLTSQNGSGVVYVRDNGVGFDMRYADRLFGVFQRLHRPEEFEGAGVGLATVQRIVHKHGGQIWAEAEREKGAAFYFTIGAALAPVVSEGRAASAKPCGGSRSNG